MNELRGGTNIQPSDIAHSGGSLTVRCYASAGSNSGVALSSDTKAFCLPHRSGGQRPREGLVQTDADAFRFRQEIKSSIAWGRIPTGGGLLARPWETSGSSRRWGREGAIPAWWWKGGGKEQSLGSFVLWKRQPCLDCLFSRL